MVAGEVGRRGGREGPTFVGAGAGQEAGVQVAARGTGGARLLRLLLQGGVELHGGPGTGSGGTQLLGGELRRQREGLVWLCGWRELGSRRGLQHLPGAAGRRQSRGGAGCRRHGLAAPAAGRGRSRELDPTGARSRLLSSSLHQNPASRETSQFSACLHAAECIHPDFEEVTTAEK